MLCFEFSRMCVESTITNIYYVHGNVKFVITHIKIGLYTCPDSTTSVLTAAQNLFQSGQPKFYIKHVCSQCMNDIFEDNMLYARLKYTAKYLKGLFGLFL
jgi:hypothetical protein